MIKTSFLRLLPVCVRLSVVKNGVELGLKTEGKEAARHYYKYPLLL